MSTLSEREAALRRALLAAAEQIEPAPDSLQRIQARLRPPQPLVIAWLQGLWASLILRAPSGLQAAGHRVASAARPVLDGLRGRPDPAHGANRSMGWVRPVAAMSVAVFVIAAGAYVAFSGSTFLGSPAGQNSVTSPGGGNSVPGGGGRSKGTESPLSNSASTDPDTSPSASVSAAPCPSTSVKSSSPPAPSSPAQSSPPSSPSPTVSPPSPSPTTAAPNPSNSAGGMQSGSTGSGPSAGTSSKLTAFLVGQLPGSAQARGACKPGKKRHKAPHSAQASPDVSTTAAADQASPPAAPNATAKID